jgi:protein-disulfide isomerase-like protein with CxxC motif
MTDERDAERGRQAQDVLANPVYVDSYARIEQELMNKWRDSRDAHEREQLHRLLMALGLVKSQMESVMRTGKVALDKIVQRQSLAQRIGLRRNAA